MEERSQHTLMLGVAGGVFGTLLTLAVLWWGMQFLPAGATNHFSLSNILPFIENAGESRGAAFLVDDSDGTADVSTVVEQVSPSIVSIVVSKSIDLETQPQGSIPFGIFPFQQVEPAPTPGDEGEAPEPIEVGAGSGFVVSKDGLIMTNRHVVRDEDATYTVTFEDGSQYDATVVARDTLTDLALLKIEAENLPVLPLGDSDALKKGQPVIAIGNTLGEYENTVTRGIVSGLSRALGGEYTGLIQTDAAINQGNSGGPLLNIAGEVIGINTAVDRSGEGIGFAIPINDAKTVIESVEKDGKIVRPGLGVRYIPITPALAKANNLSYEYGAYIRGTAQQLGIIPGSAAEKAGLKEGDIILEINGEKIDEKKPLSFYIRSKRIGEQVTIKYARDGKEQVVNVTLAEIPITPTTIEE